VKWEKWREKVLWRNDEGKYEDDNKCSNNEPELMKMIYIVWPIDYEEGKWLTMKYDMKNDGNDNIMTIDEGRWRREMIY